MNHISIKIRSNRMWCARSNVLLTICCTKIRWSPMSVDVIFSIYMYGFVAYWDGMYDVHVTSRSQGLCLFYLYKQCRPATKNAGWTNWNKLSYCQNFWIFLFFWKLADYFCTMNPPTVELIFFRLFCQNRSKQLCSCISKLGYVFVNLLAIQQGVIFKYEITYNCLMLYF